MYGLDFPDFDPAEFMPLEAMLQVKGLNIKTNQIQYRECVTKGLAPAECLGMSVTSSDTWRHVLMNKMNRRP